MSDKFSCPRQHARPTWTVGTRIQERRVPRRLAPEFGGVSVVHARPQRGQIGYANAWALENNQPPVTLWRALADPRSSEILPRPGIARLTEMIPGSQETLTPCIRAILFPFHSRCRQYDICHSSFVV